MGNIWEFLLQTAEVTLTACILLLVKLLFQDKLSPRWQYGVWMILAVKLLVPVGFFDRYMSLNLAAYLELLKNNIESQMLSQFSAAYQMILPTSTVPVLAGSPKSLTDWLFVIYTVGVVISVVYYLWGYLRLKLIIRRGWQPGGEFQQRMAEVCDAYQLSPCKTKIIDGIDSAFVCGLLHPILVIPASQEETLDEKIIIHELMHKKNFDAWQNVFWCVMRCLHWCNPIMQMVFNRIGNDMESLCDQRVLECIAGEERRDYGRILLAMTNQKYARAMGTTSVSNGGRNIRRRIEAIVRFKRYPKGMTLVSVCICILLITPVFGGTANRDLDADSVLDGNGKLELARARVMGCSTQAGAIDTYIKGLLHRKETYLAASMPLEKQDQMENIASEIHLEPKYAYYYVMNLKESKAGEYDAYVLLCEDFYIDGEGESHTPAVLLPIHLCQDVRGWNVELSGEPLEYEVEEDIGNAYENQLPARTKYQQDFEQGVVILEEQTIAFVKKETQATDDWTMFFSDRTMDYQANPDAEFEWSRLYYRVTCESHLSAEERKNITRADLSVRALKKVGDEPNWSEDAIHRVNPDGGEADGDGMAVMTSSYKGDWDGTLILDFGFFDTYSELQDAEAYAVRVYLNRLPSENIIIEREEAGK